MPDAVHARYQAGDYPALSHAVAHPARLAVAARLGGIAEPADPARARVLDLGCASGHHLLPLAAAYPEASFTGLDFSATSIEAAQAHAEALGLDNLSFHHADLREWDPGEARYDYLVAHGMLSWIPDESKAALLQLAAACLGPHGVAALSFNTLPGWALRREAATMLKALPPLEPGKNSLEERIGQLANVARLGESPYARHLTAILDDMKRKGARVVEFDELGPTSDPLHFAQVVEWAGNAGLRYLGESDLAENLPPGLPPESLTRLHALAEDPLRFQQTLDLLSGRTHRSSLFARSAETPAPVATAVTLEGAARLLEHELPPEALPGEAVATFHAALNAASPSAVAVRRLLDHTEARLGSAWDPARATREIAGWLYQGARLGWVELRHDPVVIEPVPPERPRLSPLNRRFAAAGLPLVDAFHHSLEFPANHRAVVAALDGAHRHDELAALAAREAPELHLEPWLVHLASRGLFPRG